MLKNDELRNYTRKMILLRITPEYPDNTMMNYAITTEKCLDYTLRTLFSHHALRQITSEKRPNYILRQTITPLQQTKIR
jgi:hypothetical protein